MDRQNIPQWAAGLILLASSGFVVSIRNGDPNQWTVEDAHKQTVHDVRALASVAKYLADDIARIETRLDALEKRIRTN